MSSTDASRSAARRAAWRVRRAREMSPRELPHRVREQLRRRVDGIRRPPAAPPGPLPRWPASMRLDRSDRARIAAARERWRAQPIEARTRWHVDPDSGAAWPRVPWPDLRRIGRDPKPSWALHRLQHLQLPALAGDPDVLRDLRSWLDQNPAWQGIGWAAGLEVACRVVSLVLIADRLRDAFDEELILAVRSALLAHGTYLERHPSLHSSANNHRLAEAAALVLLGATTDLPAAPRWLAVGREAIARVLPALVLDDGVGGEMSVRYQAFALEWALLARAAAPLDAEVDHRLALGAAHLSALLDGGGHCPAIGDDDDGVVLHQGLDEPRYVCSVVGALGAALGRPGLIPPCWRPDLRARLLGVPELAGRATGEGRAFPIGGLTVLASPRLRVTVDHGPLGWPALAAHGHADALAIWASLDDAPLLVGCGTFRYLGGGGWRSWLRGTAAHNTVIVDGLDSSEQADDPFLWRTRARCLLEEVRVERDGGVVRAAHDGYLRRLGVVHRRTVRLRGDFLEVVDRLEGAGTRHVAVALHLAPGLEVRRIAERSWLVDDRAEIVADLDGAIVTRRPEDGPGPGVRSPRYGELVGAPTLWLEEVVDLPWTHAFRIRAR